MKNNRKKTEILKKNPLIFKVDLCVKDDRLDIAWLNPIIKNKINKLKRTQGDHRKILALKKIADVNGGKRLPKGTVVTKGEFNTIPYVRATDIKNLRINLDRVAMISKLVHQGIQNYQLKENDIAMTIVGTIGEVGILKKNIEVCDFSENVARIRSKNNNVSQLYLLHFLDSELGKIQTERLKAGSLQYKLSLANCRNLNIYLPTSKDKIDKNKQTEILSEIHQIITKSNKKYLESKELIESSQNIVENKLKIDLKQKKEKDIFEVELNKDPFCRLDVLFNNPIREGIIDILKKHPYKLLGDIIKPQRGKKIIPSDYYNLVELENIDEKTGRITSSLEKPELSSKKILLTKNSILISKLQPEKGKIAIVNEEYDGCVGSSELIPINLNSEDFLLDYLWIILRSEYVLNQWKHELTGSSRMRIGWNEINNTIIPVVDKKIQREIIEETRDIIQKSDKALKQANRLYLDTKKRFMEKILEV